MFTKVFCLPALLAVALAALPSTASASFLIDDFGSSVTAPGNSDVSPIGRSYVNAVGTSSAAFNGIFTLTGTPSAQGVFGGVLTYGLTPGFSFSPELGVLLENASVTGGNLTITLSLDGTDASSTTLIGGASAQNAFLSFGTVPEPVGGFDAIALSFSSVESVTFTASSLQAVPEPTSIALALIGGAGCLLGVVRRRRKAKLATC